MTRAQMNDTDRRNAVTRLPKWAQDEIVALQRKIAEQARHIAELSAGPEDSDVRVLDHVYPDRPLGKGARIGFDAGDPHPDGTRDQLVVEHSQDHPGWIDITVRSRWRSQAVYVAQTGATNVARVGPGPL